MKTEQLLEGFFAGFDLGGWRQPNGTLDSALNGASIKEWPSEITVFGHTYTLESVKKGGTKDFAVWENALYA